MIPTLIHAHHRSANDTEIAPLFVVLPECFSLRACFLLLLSALLALSICVYVLLVLGAGRKFNVDHFQNSIASSDSSNVLTLTYEELLHKYTLLYSKTYDTLTEHRELVASKPNQTLFQEVWKTQRSFGKV